MRRSTPRGIAPQTDQLGIVTHASPDDPEVDIIFVHGLDGGSFSTWAKAGDPRLFWLKEWLPGEIGLDRARIHTFGYNLNPKRDLYYYTDFSRQLLVELTCSPAAFGKHPIILVGHSTGGLVIKSAYHMAVTTPALFRLACTIKSLVFLATPHNPLEKSLIRKWQKLNHCLIAKSSMDTILKAARDQFLEVSNRNIHILSFIEGKGTPVKLWRVVLVDQDTAKVGIEGERFITLEASHYSICQFSSPKNANYVTFCGELSELVKKSVEMMHPSGNRDPWPAQTT